ncbi:MAG: FKBP-type peptidyl-prolyl cis-trans isomerase [Bacteroidota bacterium]
MRTLFGSLASLGLLVVLLPAASMLSGCDSDGNGGVTCMDTEAFDIEDITPDSTTTGDTVEDGACVSVTYVGRRFDDGFEFDSGSGLRFFVGQGGGVINGFWLGVREQKVGETRRVIIPSSLGYGSRELTDGGEVIIPACATLEFEVTVDDILPSSSCF